MNRLLKAAAALVCAFGFGICVHAQLTTITASNISMGGTAISTGTVTFVPVDSRGTAISFATGGGGLNGPVGFSCVITAGAINGSCQVPDAALTTPANILYSIQVSDTSTGNKNSGKAFTLQQVANVTGSSWALDHYGPPASTTAVQTLQVVYGSAAPPNPCLTPSLYIQSTNGGSAYICVAGTPVLIGGASIPSIVPSNLKSRLVAEYHFRDGSGTVAKDSSGGGNDISLTTAMNSPLWLNGGLNFPNPTSTSTQYAALVPSAVASAGTTYLEVACFTPFFNGPTIGLSSNYTTFMSSSTSGIAFTLAGQWGNGVGIYGFGIEQGNSSAKTDASDYISSAGCHSLTWQIPVSSGTGSDQLFYDGAEVSGYRVQGNTHALLGVGNFYLGGCNGCGGGSRRNAAMTVYGLYVFNAPLTSAELAAFSGQALAVAQAQGAPVVPTPVSVTGNIALCGIDSLSYGYPGTPATGFCNGTNFIPTETISHYYDMGVVSRYLTAAASAASYELQLYNSPLARHKTLILWGCTNDAQAYSSSGGLQTASQACVTTFAGMAQSAHALGYKVIAVPMISRTGLDTVKNTYDGQFRATWQQYADGFADVANDPNLGADGANTNTTYFGSDKIHLTAATGYPLVGTYVTNAYNKLYGSTATAYNTTSAATYTIKAADSFLIANSTANAIVLTLPNCLGYGGSWRIKTTAAANAVTLKTATSAQTIDGTDYSSSGKTLAASTSTLLTVVPGDASTGGCTWTLN